MNEPVIVRINGEPWVVEEFEPYQKYLCEHETDDPPFSCKEIARFELISNPFLSSVHPDAAGRLYLCGSCLEKLKC